MLLLLGLLPLLSLVLHVPPVPPVPGPACHKATIGAAIAISCSLANAPCVDIIDLIAKAPQSGTFYALHSFRYNAGQLHSSTDFCIFSM